MGKMKKNSSNRIIVLFILIFCVCTEIYSAETIRMNIGENTTLRPSDLSSKTLAGQPSWTSSRPDDVVVESVTMYSCTIKAKKSFSGYALVQCVYYYRELDPYDPDHIHQRKGNINYHVFTASFVPFIIHGTAVVTATTSNGLTASCTVTVKKNGDNSGNNDNSDNSGQNNTNYDELDYYFQIAKKRMNALRSIAIQQHKK